MRLKRLRLLTKSQSEKKYSEPKGTILNVNGDPIWINPEKDDLVPIDKFKVDEPSKEFKEQMEVLTNTNERILRSQIKSINQGYADTNTPGFNKERTHYLENYQDMEGEDSLPYSKSLDEEDRFNYAIHRPKKEGGKHVSHVEPVNCVGHYWRGHKYGHNKKGGSGNTLSDEDKKKLKALGKKLR